MFYFEVKSIEKKITDIELIFSIFHKSSYLHNNSIGISFPYQNNGQLNSIRFFAKSKEILNLLLNFNEFQDILDTDSFIFKNIKEVPENAIPFKIKRKRLDTKYLNKVGKKTLVKTKTNSKNNKYFFENGILNEVFFIKTLSNSNNNQFSIFYYYEQVDLSNISKINNNHYSSYGFSKENSYVYHF